MIGCCQVLLSFKAIPNPKLTSRSTFTFARGAPAKLHHQRRGRRKVGFAILRVTDAAINQHQPSSHFPKVFRGGLFEFALTKQKWVEWPNDSNGPSADFK
jgi:hypothetical protein